jgi:hypothetical protein
VSRSATAAGSSSVNRPASEPFWKRTAVRVSSKFVLTRGYPRATLLRTSVSRSSSVYLASQ